MFPSAKPTSSTAPTGYVIILPAVLEVEFDIVDCYTVTSGGVVSGGVASVGTVI